MAEKATASSSKTQLGRTFAQATATSVASVSPFAQTECNVSLEKHLPKVKLPHPAGLYPVFFDLRSTTALQVRHVLGEWIHQACTFSLKTSKSVGASSWQSDGSLITKSQRQVIHCQLAIWCGPISTISPCSANCLWRRTSITATERTGMFESLTKV